MDHDDFTLLMSVVKWIGTVAAAILAIVVGCALVGWFAKLWSHRKCWSKRRVIVEFSPKKKGESNEIVSCRVMEETGEYMHVCKEPTHGHQWINNNKYVHEWSAKDAEVEELKKLISK